MLFTQARIVFMRYPALQKRDLDTMNVSVVRTTKIPITLNIA